MIQAVDRALRILTALQGGRRMSLGEIAQRLDLPPSTVHGIIRTLVAHGMVAQEPDSQRYRLGPATLRLGNVYLDTLELRSRAGNTKPVTGDFFPAYDEDGGLLVGLTPR